MGSFADEEIETAAEGETDAAGAELTGTRTNASDGGHCVLQSLLACTAPADLIRVMPIAGRHQEEVGGLRRTVALRAEPGVTLH
jgi:hypothetical protein